MMAENYQLVEKQPGRPLAMHPQKFALWLFIVTVMMIFAAMTSAHIVRQADGNWLSYDMPQMLTISTIIIALSSGFLHWAYMSAKKDKLAQLKLAMTGAVVLGLAFLATQFAAWGQLVDAGVYFVGNPGGSFMYVITGLHGAHLISGVIYLIYVLVQTFRFKVHAKNMLNMEMCTTYWHFLGGLWVYLFIFLYLNHSSSLY